MRHGFDCTVLFGVNERGEVDPTLPVYPGKGERGRPNSTTSPAWNTWRPPISWSSSPAHAAEVQIRAHRESTSTPAGPFLALRTANHGFSVPLPYKINGRQVRWGEDVLGGTFLNHHGEWMADSTRGIIVEEQRGHPVLAGVTDIWGDSDVYRTYEEGKSLPAGCTALVWGQPLLGRRPEDPPNEKLEPLPVAWLKHWQTSGGRPARVFHSTMGSASDLKSAGLRRLIINATYWGLGLESAINVTRSVEVAGDYQPLGSGFDYPRLGVVPKPVSACK